MKTCKVRPTANDCYMCSNVADILDEMPDCTKCVYNNIRYELVAVESGFFKDHAFVLANCKFQKVALDRVYDIKEEKG